MEQHLIHRAVVHRQATQFVLRIADESPAILNVILRSLSVNYGSIACNISCSPSLYNIMDGCLAYPKKYRICWPFLKNCPEICNKSQVNGFAVVEEIAMLKM